MLKEATGQAIPDIVWDGMVVPGKQPEEILCIANNGGASFVNLDAANGFAEPSFDSSVHQCSLPSLSVISLSSASQ
jgi:hypothetical protein